MERLFLIGLLAAPFAMLFAAIRMRRARERGAAARPWDRSLRNGLLLGLLGGLLLVSGLAAYARAAGSGLAPLFAVPVIAGVVLAVSGYRTWMGAVEAIPDDQ